MTFMKTKLKQWIYPKSKDRERERELPKRRANDYYELLKSVFSSGIIALSGLILYSDKVLASINIQFGIPAKFKDTGMDFQTYVWLLSQTISPLLIILGSIMRPFFLSYIIPIYCYCLQLYFIFFDYKLIDDDYIDEYALGTSILVFLVFYSIRKIDRYIIMKKINAAKEELKKYSRDE